MNASNGPLNEPLAFIQLLKVYYHLCHFIIVFLSFFLAKLEDPLEHLLSELSYSVNEHHVLLELGEILSSLLLFSFLKLQC